MKTILSVFLLGTLFTYAQVGIGTTSPAPGSILDITSPDKGILIPRVALTATNNPAPITPAPIEGLMVYNTATAGTLPNIVTPGFYFWNGTVWTRVATGGTVTKDWSVTGNGDIDATTDVLGTTNNQDLVIVTNDNERIRVASNGNVGINTTPSERLHVNGNLRLQGAIMPGGDAGITNKVLLSNGANNSPNWSPFIMGNTPATTEIAKYYVLINLGPGNWSNNEVITRIVNDPACRPGSSISASIVNWQSNYSGISIRNIATETGQFRITLQNLTGTPINNGTLQLAFIAFY